MVQKKRKLQQKFKLYIDEVVKLKITPHEIALGFAIGVFIGLLPTPGLNIALAFLVVFVFKKVNKLSLFGAITILNPIIVTPPVLYLSHRIGGLFVTTGLRPGDFGYYAIYKIVDVTLNILIGSLIIALPLSILSYFIAKPIVKKLLKKYGKKRG